MFGDTGREDQGVLQDQQVSQAVFHWRGKKTGCCRISKDYGGRHVRQGPPLGDFPWGFVVELSWGRGGELGAIKGATDPRSLITHVVRLG